MATQELSVVPSVIPHHQAAKMQRALIAAALAIAANDSDYKRLCDAAERNPALRRLRDQIGELRAAGGAIAGVAA